MRVLLAHQELNHRGGTERQFIDTIRGFARAGAVVTVAAARVDPAIALPAVRVVAFPAGGVPKPLRPMVFDRRVRALLARERFDAVIGLSRLRAPVTLYCAGVHEGWLRAKGGLRGPFDLLYRRFEAQAFRGAARVAACAPFIRDELVRFYGVDPARVVVVPPPLDVSRFRREVRVDREAHRARFGVAPGTRAFAFVSTGHARKGLDLLRAAFERLPDGLELLVAGTPVEPSRNVRSLGFVKDPEALYAAADFTVLPAAYEPFGLVVPESLACGTPVLVTEHVGAAGLLGPGDGVVVPTRDPGAWAEALRDAAARTFRVDEHFVERHALALDAHVARLAALAVSATRAPGPPSAAPSGDPGAARA